MNRRSSAALLLLAAACVLPAGCDRGRATLDRALAAAATPGTGRAAVTSEIVAGMTSGRYLPGDAVDHAYERLAEAEATPGGSGRSAQYTAYAGGVLDAIAQLEGAIKTDAEFEVFWTKVGRLAFKAAEEAFANQRPGEASTLVFAGGRRWQGDSYWNRHPDHDALAAVLLAQAGQRDEALRRLRSRIELSGPAAEVYQMLTAPR